MSGQDWCHDFLKRKNLYFKRGCTKQYTRKSVTADPFVIYEFYTLLSKLMTQLDLHDKPDHIWNLDETLFPIYPYIIKDLETKGVETVCVTADGSRKNYVVLACCSAAGVALDPLFIFQSNNANNMSIYYGENDLRDTLYHTSPNGCINSDIFLQFLQSFANQVTHRPLLVLLDGHASYVGFEVLSFANDNDIYLVKFPPHCPDLLQPLDVSCFAPLNCCYDRELERFNRIAGGIHQIVRLKKNEFVNMVCFVWKEGLSEKNIKAGFKKTGIFPLDENIYDINIFDPKKMQTYKRWLDSGAQRDENNKPRVIDMHSVGEDNSVLEVLRDQNVVTMNSSLECHATTRASTPQPLSRSQNRANRLEIDENFTSNVVVPNSVTESEMISFRKFTNEELVSLVHYLYEKRTGSKICVEVLPPQNDEVQIVQALGSLTNSIQTTSCPIQSQNVEKYGQILSLGTYYEKMKQLNGKTEKEKRRKLPYRYMIKKQKKGKKD